MSKPKAKTKNQTAAPTPDPKTQKTEPKQVVPKSFQSACAHAPSSDMKVSLPPRRFPELDWTCLWLFLALIVCVVSLLPGSENGPKLQRDVATRHRISSSVSVEFWQCLRISQQSRPPPHTCCLRPCHNMPHAQLIVLVVRVCVCVCVEHMYIIYFIGISADISPHS